MVDGAWALVRARSARHGIALGGALRRRHAVRAHAQLAPPLFAPPQIGVFLFVLLGLRIAAHLRTAELVHALRRHDLPVVQRRAPPTPAQA
eukprot:4406625-Pyramimonas_sp.AAC.1